MRNYSKTGKKPGKPGYRTSSAFIARQKQDLRQNKPKQKYAYQSKSISRSKKSRNC